MKSVRAKLIVLNILVVAMTLAVMGLALRARLRANLMADLNKGLESDIGSIAISHVSPADPVPLAEGDQWFFDMRRIEGSSGSTGGATREFPTFPPGGESKGFYAKLSGSPPNPAENQNKIVEMYRSNNSQVRLEAQSQPPRLIPVSDPVPPGMTPPYDPEGISLAKSGAKQFHDYKQGGNPMRSISVPVSEGGRLIAVAQAVRSLAPIRVQIAELDRGLATTVPLAVLVSAVFGLLLVGGTLRPLRRMIDSAKRLEPDLSGERLPVSGEDEFAQLAAAFNQAFDTSAAAFQKQREAIDQLEQFTADAGHELRTPVAAIKSGTGYLLHMADLPADCRKPVVVMDRSADRMAKLIDDLLLLSRQDGGQPLRMADGVDLRLLIEQALEELPGKADAQLRLQLADTPPLHADPDALKRVFLNLIANALSYARSWVAVSSRTAPSGVQIEIQDDGEGIAPEDLARLGERFFRPDTARSRECGGTGLGIAIAKSLVASHGGTLEFESALGRGTTARVSLPYR